ncbi:MAG TPA: hypothetical protein VIJ19_09920, partial [Opitutaceae bacterium]
DATRFTFRFEGGSLRKLLDLLDTNLGWKVSVVPDTDLSDVMVPAFSLRDARRGQVLDVVALLLKESRYSFIPIGESVVVLKPREDPGSVPIARDLTEALKSRTLEDIEDAIRTACTLVPGAKYGSLEIKYHPTTRLLLVKGPKPSVAAALSVLDGLKAPAPKP